MNDTDPSTNVNCPNDASLWAKISSGQLSGHIDFEPLNNPRWNNDFALSCVKQVDFPLAKIAYIMDFPSTSCMRESSTYPLVARTMDVDTSGIYKPRRCADFEDAGVKCDGNTPGATRRSVHSSSSFKAWYRDDVIYNKRFGYAQTLQRVGGTTSSVYSFSSSTDDPIVGTERGIYAATDSNLGLGFYDPIHENRKMADAFPKTSAMCFGCCGFLPLIPTRCERDYNLTNTPYPIPSRFFSFTTQISTFFEYGGTELFSFNGDDDVFVYVDEKLVLDLGGVHPQISGTLNFTYGTKLQQYLGLEIGEIYSLIFFNAERQTLASNFRLTTSLAQTCNVVTTELRTNEKDVEVGLNWPASANSTNTKRSDFFFLGGPTFAYMEKGDTLLQLMTPNNYYAVGYAFYKTPQNIGSGFRLVFSFNASASVAVQGDAMSVIFHSRTMGLKNLNGGSGPNAGIKNLDHSFAVVFDFCTDRGVKNCSETSLGLHYNNQGNMMNSASQSTRKVWENVLVNNWKDGRIHQVEILYYSRPDWLEVYVDDDLRLVQRNFDVSSILGGRNAYVGFAASTSEHDLAISLIKIKMTTVKVPSRFSYFIPSTSLDASSFVANGRAQATFRIGTKDACKNPVDFGGLGTRIQSCIFTKNACENAQVFTNDPLIAYACLNASMTSVVARPGWINSTTYYQCATNLVITGSTSNTGTGRRRLITEQEAAAEVSAAYISDDDSGTYAANFKTFVTGTYSMCIADGEGCVWDPIQLNFTGIDCSFTCKLNTIVATTYVPPTNVPPIAAASTGVSEATIIGLGVSMGVLAMAFCVAFACFCMWRKQWKREKRFIEAGRVAAAEKGVEYVGDTELEQLQNKLQAVLIRLQRERMKRGGDAHVTRAEIDRLLTQKGELQEQIRMLQMRAGGGGHDSESRRSDDLPFEALARKAWKKVVEIGDALTPAPREDDGENHGFFGYFYGPKLQDSGRAPQLNDVALDADALRQKKNLESAPPPEQFTSTNPIFLAIKSGSINMSGGAMPSSPLSGQSGQSSQSSPTRGFGGDAPISTSRVGGIEYTTFASGLMGAKPVSAGTDGFVPSAAAVRRQSKYQPQASGRRVNNAESSQAKLEMDGKHNDGSAPLPKPPPRSNAGNSSAFVLE